VPEESSHELRVAFEARGRSGLVVARVAPNRVPHALGAAPGAEGFPVCEATVSSDLAGYDALFGWVQLVRVHDGSDSGRQFEPDPLAILDHLDLPFGFYGLHPTLFDAPSRSDRRQRLDWLAHSFLCISPGEVMGRAVQPVAAFQWGFQLAGDEIVIIRPSVLALTTWEHHRPTLAAAYPSWRFDPAP
jgi:hypothetical protein